MLSDQVERIAGGVHPVHPWAPERDQDAAPDWRAVDRALRGIRRRRDALDAEEAHWLRQAEALQIWRPLGMVSALDYLERVLGYAPRTAQDRLRVARALGDLPRLTAALDAGALAFSAVRELTRVATPATEAAWIAAATGKNLRQIEELVVERRPGDRPDDPPDPQVRTRVVRFDLSPGTFALLRQVRTALDDEHGTSLSDDGFIATLCSAVLDRAPGPDSSGRARYQIAMTVCQRCRQGWQEGGGAQIPVSPSVVERAMCDAEDIGSLDGPGPERAQQGIPPSIARFVRRRDGGRCRVPGCRSARGLEIHHILRRADGGTNDAANLVLVCSACHQAHHAGALKIAGTSERLEVHRPNEPVGATEADAFTMPSDASRRAAAHVGVAPSVASPVEPAAASSAAGGGSPQTRLPGSSLRRVTAHVGATRPGADSGAPPRVCVAGQPRVAPGGPAGVVNAGVAPRAADAGVAPRVADAGVRASAHVGQTPDQIPERLASLRAQATQALTGLGWKPTIAHAAVAAAAAATGPDPTLEQLIIESLRCCSLPPKT